MKKSEIKLPAGKRTLVFRRVSSSIPMDYRFRVFTENGEAVSGTLEVQGSQWIFPKPVQKTALKSDNTVSAGYWDTFFSVYMTADTDAKVEAPKRSSMKWIWILLLILSILMAAALIIAQS